MSDPTADMENAENNPCPDDPEYTALWEVYQKAKKANEYNERKLISQYGPNATLSGADGLQARMEMMLNVVLPPTDPKRVEFEIEWQRMIARSLVSLESHIKKIVQQQSNQIILPNGSADPSLFLPPDIRGN